MASNVLDVTSCSLKDLVLSISAKFSLELDKLGLSLLDMLTDFRCVLLQEVLIVPPLLIISEGLPDSPETVPDEELLLELFYLRDVSNRNLEGLLVGLELTKPLDAIVKPLLDLGGFIKGLLCWRLRPDQGLAGCHLLDESLDFFLLLEDSLFEFLQVAISGFSGVFL